MEGGERKGFFFFFNSFPTRNEMKIFFMNQNDVIFSNSLPRVLKTGKNPLFMTEKKIYGKCI